MTSHEFTSWWLNQPIGKICSSNWIISPRTRGENDPKFLSYHHLSLFHLLGAKKKHQLQLYFRPFFKGPENHPRNQHILRVVGFFFFRLPDISEILLAGIMVAGGSPKQQLTTSQKNDSMVSTSVPRGTLMALGCLIASKNPVGSSCYYQSKGFALF